MKKEDPMQHQTVSLPLFYYVIVINTIKVHRINHMHARADATAIQNTQHEVSRSITKKNIGNHPFKRN
jgi:hypothetical protein